MNINELKRLQFELDDKAGFPVKFTNNKDKYDQITKDLVGLFGEIGEFSNIVKKINIKNEKKEKYELDIELAEELLCEELIDCFIYILRLSEILNIDLEDSFLKKLRRNNERYAKLK